MKSIEYRYRFAVLLLFIVSCILLASCKQSTATNESKESPPDFKVDPFWPKPLPNNWIIGQVSGVAVDADDNIWIVHRPGSLEPDEIAAAQNPPTAICCIPAPPVIEFDQEGNVIQAWGGAGEGYDWPQAEHGIFVDHKNNIWLAGSSTEDHQVLKFTSAGKFVLQIGKSGNTGGSNDTKYLGRPADITVDPETNEVYIADGYVNRRIIVFDGNTGEYKRHWGAYGNHPDDMSLGDYKPSAEPAPQFRNPVHGVLISNDGLVYVCDRKNNRIQVFQKDGSFIKEGIVARNTAGNGTTWDIDFSSDANQRFLYTSDGTNQVVWILRRQDLQTVGSFGRSGRYAGQFHCLHNVAVDSKGNIYTTEVQTGKRVQKFNFKGIL